MDGASRALGSRLISTIQIQRNYMRGRVAEVQKTRAAAMRCDPYKTQSFSLCFYYIIESRAPSILARLSLHNVKCSLCTFYWSKVSPLALPTAKAGGALPQHRFS